MTYKKEHLEQLLEFVRVLYNNPECKDFAEGIRALVGEVSGIYNVPKIEKIEQYLGLDYGIDTAINPNYSFIKDKKTRETLNADWREMLRFRYGLRGHVIDFGEFSRFANLQMEMILNMYYSNKYGNDDAILNVLQKYAQSTPTSKNYVPTYLSLKAKVDGLKGEFGWQFTDIETLLNVIKVRNIKSHRLLEENLYKKLSLLKAKADLTEEDQKTLINLQEQLKKSQKLDKWIQTTPFSEVELALEKLTERIKKSIIY